MAERITRADLDAVVENLNQRLPDHVRVAVEFRYGYVAIDEYQRDADRAGGWALVRALTTGNTKREAYDAVWHMLRAIDLLSTPPRGI